MVILTCYYILESIFIHDLLILAYVTAKHKVFWQILKAQMG